jgi:molybdenum cofactor biosynthesis enzyme
MRMICAKGLRKSQQNSLEFLMAGDKARRTVLQAARIGGVREAKCSPHRELTKSDLPRTAVLP